LLRTSGRVAHGRAPPAPSLDRRRLTRATSPRLTGAQTIPTTWAFFQTRAWRRVTTFNSTAPWKDQQAQRPGRGPTASKNSKPTGAEGRAAPRVSGNLTDGRVIIEDNSFRGVRRPDRRRASARARARHLRRQQEGFSFPPGPPWSTQQGGDVHRTSGRPHDGSGQRQGAALQREEGRRAVGGTRGDGWPAGRLRKGRDRRDPGSIETRAPLLARPGLWPLRRESARPQVFSNGQGGLAESQASRRSSRPSYRGGDVQPLGRSRRAPKGVDEWKDTRKRAAERGSTGRQFVLVLGGARAGPPASRPTAPFDAR
jgi:hypothetical protein